MIKKINPGIQIVIFTASDKIWNFQKCLDLGISGYAIKEDPEYYHGRSETYHLFNHFRNEIVRAKDRSYLSRLKTILDELKIRNRFKNEKEFQSYVFDKNGLLDQIFNLLVLSSDKTINQCLLICFQILENYCDLSSVGSFSTTGKAKGPAKQIKSGFIWTKDNSRTDIFSEQNDNNIYTRFELVYGRFDLQVIDSPETPISYISYNRQTVLPPYKEGLDVSSLVKIISVLVFRDQIGKEEIERILKLRYYRSNVAAHLTGRVKTTFTIGAKEIIFFIELFKKLFQ